MCFFSGSERHQAGPRPTPAPSSRLGVSTPSGSLALLVVCARPASVWIGCPTSKCFLDETTADQPQWPPQAPDHYTTYERYVRVCQVLIIVIFLGDRSPLLLSPWSIWLDRATIRFRFIGHCRTCTGSFCVFGPALSSPSHGSISLAMGQIEIEIVFVL
jgi:hypothetical protein